MFRRTELLLPLVVLGSCGALTGLVVQPKLACAKAAKVRLDLRILGSASKLWLRSHPTFPTTEEGLEAMVREGILESVPTDTSGRPYQYESLGRTCRIYTLGEDGRWGGADDDQEVFLWLSLPPDSDSLRSLGPAPWPPSYRPRPATSHPELEAGAGVGLRTGLCWAGERTGLCPEGRPGG